MTGARSPTSSRVVPQDALQFFGGQPAAANVVLRAIFERIDLGPDLRPKPDGFVWRNEAWRA